MAELLVRVIDKVNKESVYLDCGCTKRGDVIAACPDGWAWGSAEVSDPQYQIVKVPDLSLEEAAALTAQDVGFGKIQASRTLLKRTFHLDLEGLPEKVTAADIRQARVRKPVIADPAVIGDDPKVIG